MKENNKKEKDNVQIPNKIKNQNFNSSLISPKKVISKNYMRNKKGDFQTQNSPNMLLEENMNHSNTKFGYNSPDIKTKPNEVNSIKSLQKKLVNNQNEIKIQRQKKFQKFSINNSSINNPILLNLKEEKSIEKEKDQKRNTPNNKSKIIVNPKRVINDNQNKIDMNNSTNVSHSQKSKKIKINTIKNTKNNRNILIDDKKNKMSRGSVKNENYIDNFTLGELDENIEKNIYNSRKHYSLTNPNILPCIPFSNPFSNKKHNNINNNSNVNVTENNEKNEITKNPQNNNNKNKKEVLENNFFNDNLKINSNIFDSNSKNNKVENEPEEEDVKLNISNLEIDIDQMNDEVDEDNSPKNEIQIKSIHKNYKSFIQFNNNLSFKLAVEKSKNTPSYILALCPNLFKGLNKKKIIKENYAVNDAISEEMDSDTLTPKNSKNKNSFDEKNTKYSTKEKNSDRNKKPQDFESEDGSYEENKKNIYNNSNSERKNKCAQIKYPHSTNNIDKNIGSLKKSKNNEYENIIINNENNFDDNTKTIVIKKRDKKKKKLNIKDINIETQNINNINNISLNKDAKNSPLKINYYYTSPNKSNASFHRSNNTINNIVYNETENNNYNYNKIRAKILKIKNNEYKEKHQKAKSLVSNINLSTLYLYETIQNNNTTNNNITINKKQKLFKNNIKSTDYRNKILNKEKKFIEKENTNGSNDNNNLNKKKSNEKYLFNNNNRTNSYKNEDKNNAYSTNIANKKKLKKIAFSHLLKSPKYKVNPFLSNFSSNNENKSVHNTNNNDTLYTFHNTEYKYSNYYELYKKRNNNCKIVNTNNTINAINNELNNNFTNEISITHCKKISQQFIDEYNFLLETKNDNNNTLIKNISKAQNNNDTINNNNINKKNSLNKYFSYNQNQKGNENKEAFDINNKSVKFKNKANYENSSIKKISHITPCHKKSKTFFISPSYVIKNISNINKNKIQNENEKINNLKEKIKIKENKNNFNTTAHSKNNINSKSNHKNKIINTGNKKNSKNKYYKINEKNDSKINNNDYNKNKFSEIKKIIGETSLTKIIHKKTNTIGSTNILSNLLNNNFLNYNNLIKNTSHNIYNKINSSNSTRNNSTTTNSKQLKKAASINNLINNFGNKKKIINAMQRIKFIPVSYYSKAIKELVKSKNNIFVILVFKDENQKYVFRGLYEIYEKEPKIAIKLFAPNYGQNSININNINYFYNYSFSKGDFIRYKFIDEKNKSFNEDTVIIL